MRSKSILVLLVATAASLNACSSGESRSEVSDTVPPSTGNASQPINTAAETNHATTAPSAEDVVMNGSSLVQTQALRGQNVEVTGDGNTATFTGHSQEFSITGSDNVVVLENVKAIEVTGDNNSVTWRGSTPTVTNLGQHNVIERAK
ncbi:DUF3060 domain-containing protein [Hymenobacter tenuis]